MDMANSNSDQMEIPSAVKEQVQYLLETEGGDVVYIGDYQEWEAYSYKFPEEGATGYPIVVLYHRDADYAYEVPEDKALDIVVELTKR